MMVYSLYYQINHNIILTWDKWNTTAEASTIYISSNASNNDATAISKSIANKVSPNQCNAIIYPETDNDELDDDVSLTIAMLETILK